MQKKTIPWERIPVQLVSREPCQRSILFFTLQNCTQYTIFIKMRADLGTLNVLKRHFTDQNFNEITNTWAFYLCKSLSFTLSWHSKYMNYFNRKIWMRFCMCVIHVMNDLPMQQNLSLDLIYYILINILTILINKNSNEIRYMIWCIKPSKYRGKFIRASFNWTELTVQTLIMGIKRITLMDKI